jgi:hypothetical protein
MADFICARAKRFLTKVFEALVALVVLIALALQASPAHADTFKPNFTLLYYAAQLANQAYDGKSELFGALDGATALVAVPGETRVQYVINYNTDRKLQVIAVRGTVNAMNKELNRDTVLVRDPKTGIHLHRGFRTAAITIYQDLKPKLRPGYTTYLVGHSLGGAVAAILGMYLSNDGIFVGRIVTFGQPKFTNLPGARAYSSLPLVRVIYQNDIVSLLPIRSHDGKQQLAHTGRALNLLSGPHYVLGDVERSTKFSAHSFGRMFGQGSIPDHRMKWYLKGLREKMKDARRVRFGDRNKFIIRHKAGSGVDTGPATKTFNFNQR